MSTCTYETAVPRPDLKIIMLDRGREHEKFIIANDERRISLLDCASLDELLRLETEKVHEMVMCRMWSCGWCDFRVSSFPDLEAQQNVIRVEWLR